MRDLARLAIAAFGRQGEGSGVIGVDVQRIRRTLGLKGERQDSELGDPDSVPLVLAPPVQVQYTSNWL